MLKVSDSLKDNNNKSPSQPSVWEKFTELLCGLGLKKVVQAQGVHSNFAGRNVKLETLGKQPENSYKYYQHGCSFTQVTSTSALLDILGQMVLCSALCPLYCRMFSSLLAHHLPHLSFIAKYVYVYCTMSPGR